ncbi:MULTISPECIES: adenine phosphoribosyltransferase [unclassified Leifsonia]|uniref:adenine phosphoribosyltransferase n=1 Tax=unclassified Leifsonia TaxID=2663824 RepID=UPI0006F8D898|nr:MULTISPECIES: adenine phosphoribosyltransferase [unclassified Leifsonia]KQX04934.1 adenine phosphoribosyltransferase [Leifsonia sp. Root1293]KRA08566.1 adenine phosphoribosyltransferase [Leifsonia sp. Root60]
MSNPTAAEQVSARIHVIPDFPEAGIQFQDLTPVFADAAAFRVMCEALVAPFAGTFDILGGLEARGFIIAGGASILTGAGVLPVRKAGKLPRRVITETYELEYGVASLEVHEDELPAGSRVLVIDDVLATGGTAQAACRLIERAGWAVAGVAVTLELEGLGGREQLAEYEVFSLLQA